jgi:hypothetical protein
LFQEANMIVFGESNEKTPVNEIECEKVVERMPAAGPHARADLTNFDACPGSGVLPSEKEYGRDSDPGAG